MGTGTTMEGKVVFITGGARGQGRAHALAFAGAGADIVICDTGGLVDLRTVPYPLASAEDLAITERLVRETGRDCLALSVDVRETAQVDEAVTATLTRFGRLDVCLANAGICGFGRFHEIDDEMWQEMIDVDLGGVFRTMRAVVPSMLERGSGRIIATSSMGGRMGNPNLAHYVAAKWGVIGLVKTLAAEVAARGITVNALCPASVDTPMLHNPAMYGLFCPDLDQPDRTDVEPRYAAMNRMGRSWLSPEEVATTALFLCSDAARGMTGQVVELGLGTPSGQP